MDTFVIEHLNLRYSDGSESLRDINLRIRPNIISVLFGPAGGGKSTLLRTLNRLNDLGDVESLSGQVMFKEQNILDPRTDVIRLRRQIGMVFSRPTPLPLTIYQNISYALEVAGERRKSRLDEAVEEALRQAVLWDEVYDRLHAPATAISGGQQQRLSIARVLALKPEVIMLDEPTSALDPLSTAKIESLLWDLAKRMTVILVPHSTQQAARMADFAAFFLQGELVEVGEGKTLFMNPRDQRTQDYVTGRFG